MELNYSKGLEEYYTINTETERLTVYLRVLIEDLNVVSQVLKKYDGVFKKHPLISYQEGIKLSTIKIMSVLYGQLMSTEILKKLDIPYSYFIGSVPESSNGNEHLRFTATGEKVFIEPSYKDFEKSLLSWKFQKEFRKRHKALKLLMP